MKDICEILQQKETAIAHLRKEIESLHIVGPLLQSDGL